MSPDDFLDRLLDLFAARTDVYAVGRPHRDADKRELGQLEYFPATPYQSKEPEPLTRDVLTQHLKGTGVAERGPIGVYPVVDGKVKWLAVDIDGPKTPGEDPFFAMWEIAERQIAAFEQIGLHAYGERSRSGKGAHVWAFFTDWVDAGAVRQLCKPHLVDSDFYDRMYPVQNDVGKLKRGYGNLLALPFWGKVREQGFSSFINRSTLEPINPRDFLVSVRQNAAAVVPVIAQESAELSAAVANEPDAPRPQHDGSTQGQYETGILKMLSPYGCRFMRHVWKHQDKREGPNAVKEPAWYAALSQFPRFNYGAQAAEFTSLTRKHEVDAKYENACNNPSVGCAYIHEHFPKLACVGCPMTAPYRVAEKKLLPLTMQGRTPMVKGGFATDLDRIRRRNDGELAAGFPWGIDVLDSYTRLRHGDLVLIGANPSVGKTSWLVHAVLLQAYAGRPVIYFSAESGQITLRDRLISHVAQVDSRMLRGEGRTRLTEDELARIAEACRVLDDLPIYEQYTTVSADGVLAGVEESLLKHRIGLDQDYSVFFDYLQFAAKGEEASNSRQEQVALLSSEFKAVAKVLERPVVVFSQLNRKADSDEPSMKDFRDSGRIEQDADVAMILTGEYTPGLVAPRTLWGVKQREGANKFKIDFLLHQTICHWEPLSVPDGAESTPLGLNDSLDQLALKQVP